MWSSPAWPPLLKGCRPARFFCQLSLMALSCPQGIIRLAFQKYYSSFLLFFKFCSLKLRNLKSCRPGRLCAVPCLGTSVIVNSRGLLSISAFSMECFTEGESVVNRLGFWVCFSWEGIRQDTAVSNDRLLFACVSWVEWLNNGDACWVTSVWETARGTGGFSSCGSSIMQTPTEILIRAGGALSSTCERR